MEIISNPYKKIKLNENVYLQPGNNHNNWSTRLPFSNTYLEEAGMANTHRPLHSLSPMAPLSPLPPVQQSLNNYNFNISMNLCLNQVPSMGSLLPSYNPFLEMHYQSLLMTQMSQINQMNRMSQMNHQVPFCLPPPEPIQSRSLTYIVIDE